MAKPFGTTVSASFAATVICSIASLILFIVVCVYGMKRERERHRQREIQQECVNDLEVNSYRTQQRLKEVQRLKAETEQRLKAETEQMVRAQQLKDEQALKEQQRLTYMVKKYISNSYFNSDRIKFAKNISMSSYALCNTMGSNKFQTVLISYSYSPRVGQLLSYVYINPSPSSRNRVYDVPSIIDVYSREAMVPCLRGAKGCINQEELCSFVYVFYMLAIMDRERSIILPPTQVAFGKEGDRENEVYKALKFEDKTRSYSAAKCAENNSKMHRFAKMLMVTLGDVQIDSAQNMIGLELLVVFAIFLILMTCVGFKLHPNL